MTERSVDMREEVAATAHHCGRPLSQEHEEIPVSGEQEIGRADTMDVNSTDLNSGENVRRNISHDMEHKQYSDKQIQNSESVGKPRNKLKARRKSKSQRAEVTQNKKTLSANESVSLSQRSIENERKLGESKSFPEMSNECETSNFKETPLIGSTVSPRNKDKSAGKSTQGNRVTANKDSGKSGIQGTCGSIQGKDFKEKQNKTTETQNFGNKKIGIYTSEEIENILKRTNEIITGNTERVSSDKETQFTRTEKSSARTGSKGTQPRRNSENTAADKIESFHMIATEIAADGEVRVTGRTTHKVSENRTNFQNDRKPLVEKTENESDRKKPNSFVTLRSSSEPFIPRKALLAKSKAARQRAKKKARARSQGNLAADHETTDFYDAFPESFNDFQSNENIIGQQCASLITYVLDTKGKQFRNQMAQAREDKTQVLLSRNSRFFSMDDENQGAQKLEIASSIDSGFEKNANGYGYSRVFKITNMSDREAAFGSKKTYSKKTRAYFANYNVSWTKATIRTPGKDYFIDPYLISTDVDTRYIYKGMPLTKEHFARQKVVPSQFTRNENISERTDSIKNESRRPVKTDNIVFQRDDISVPDLEEPSKMLRLNMMEIRTKPYMIKKRFFEEPSSIAATAKKTEIQGFGENVDKNATEVRETSSESCHENIRVPNITCNDNNSQIQISENSDSKRTEAAAVSVEHSHVEADSVQVATVTETKQKSILCTETESDPNEIGNDELNGTDLNEDAEGNYNHKPRELVLNPADPSLDPAELPVSVEDAVKEIIGKARKTKLIKENSQTINYDKESNVYKSNSSNVEKNSVSSQNSSSLANLEEIISNEHPDFNGNIIVDEYIPKAFDIIKERQDEELEQLNKLYKLEKSKNEGLKNRNACGNAPQNGRSFVNSKCLEIDYRRLKADCGGNVKLMHKYLFTDNNYLIHSDHASNSDSGNCQKAWAKQSLPKENPEIKSKQKSNGRPRKLTESFNETSKVIPQTELDHLTDVAQKQTPGRYKNSTGTRIHDYSLKLISEANLTTSFGALGLDEDSELHGTNTSESIKPDDSETFPICKQYNRGILSNIEPITVIDNYCSEMYREKNRDRNSNKQEINNNDEFSEQISSLGNSRDTQVKKSMDIFVIQEDHAYSKSTIERVVQNDEDLLLKNQKMIMSCHQNVPLRHTCECISYFLDIGISNEDKISRKREIQALCLEVESKRYKLNDRRINNNLEIDFNKLLREKSNVEDGKNNAAVNDNNDSLPFTEHNTVSDRKHYQKGKINNAGAYKLNQTMILDSIENLIDNYKPTRFTDVMRDEIKMGTENDCESIIDVRPSSHNNGAMNQVFTWNRTCGTPTINNVQPLRLGLSKMTKTKPLHPNLHKNVNFRI